MVINCHYEKHKGYVLKLYLLTLTILVFLAGTMLVAPSALALKGELAQVDKKNREETAVSETDKTKKAKSKAGKEEKSSTEDLKKKDAANQIKSRISWFPSWSAPSFDWGLNPIMGFAARVDSTATTEKTSVLSEIGLQLDLRGIPLWAGNPGLYLNPGAAYAMGNVYSMVKTDDDTTEYNSNFDRNWIRANFRLYWKFYRHILGITRGNMEYYGDIESETKSLNILNDMGVRILPFISSHLTLNYLTVYADRLSQPQFAEKDHWLHLSVSFDLLDSYLNFGPGFTLVDLYGASGKDWIKTDSGQTDYFLALGGMDFFWKFRLDARAKYVYRSMDQLEGSLAKIDLPTHNVSEPSSLASLPEDSLEYDLFIGAKRIIGGLGFGWKYYVLILNYQEKNDKKSETLNDQGFTLTYSLSF